MSDHENSQEEEWPPKNQKRSFHAFTTKEDGLIVDYLIDHKQFSHLGGNEVWRTMARSKKYNPAGRTFQGLRERFLRHISKRLHQFSRVTPKIRAHLLKQNPKALRDINSMKSTEELKRELGAPCSSEEEAEDANIIAPMTPVLVERFRLIEELKTKAATGPSTSTPRFETLDLRNHDDVYDVVPDEILPVVVKQEQDIEEENVVLVAAPAQDSSHLFSSSSPENSIVRPCDGRQSATTTELSRICPLFNFVFDSAQEDVTFSFKTLESLHEHREVTAALQLLQQSLRKTLDEHSNELSKRSLSCSRPFCNGTAIYFNLWAELASYHERIEMYQQRFKGIYLKFFIRVIGEILRTPLCCTKPSTELPTVDPDDLFKYLRSELSTPFRETLGSVGKLMQLVRKR